MKIWESHIEGVFRDTSFGTLILSTGVAAEGGFFRAAPPGPTTREVIHMFMPKGYYTSQGYVGFLPDGGRMFFPTHDEYLDYLRERAA